MRNLAAAAVVVVLVFLAGCSTGTVSDINPIAHPGSVAASGSVHGGQQPVSGATVQLWQVGTTGYGTGATPLGTSTLSLPDGSFSITGLYNCANGASGANTLVYITATGGNPGSGANNELAMMAALGPCGNLTASTFINIDEVTTVASVYALAQFMGPGGNIGSYGYSNTGLANAFATVNNLVDTSAGTARALTPAGNGQVPQAEINTLANIMAACINTASIGSSPSAICSALFTATTPLGTRAIGAIAPANTLNALRNVALYPWFNAGAASTLFTLITPAAPFGPALTTPPNDWTMALSFAGGVAGNEDLAIDATGNIWIANYNGGGNTSSVSKLSNLGVPYSGSPYTAGISGATGIAFDTSGLAWVTNAGFNNVVVLDTTGKSVNSFQYTETSNPQGVAIDPSNDAWITNSNNASVTQTRGNSGQTISPKNVGYTGGGLNGPQDVAIDSSGTAWVTNYANGAGNTVTRIATDGTVTSIAGGGLHGPSGIAIDANDNVWVADYYMSSGVVSEFDSTGNPLSSTGFSGGGIHNPSSIAVDGANNIWIVNVAATSNSISEITASGLPISPVTTGYQGGQVGNLKNPWVLRIDGSGNVWVASLVATQIPNTSLQANVTEFVGLAAPTVTPLSVAIQTEQVGQKPGTAIPLGIVSGALPYYSAGISYFQQLVAVGGNSGSYTWSLVSGSTLPSGLVLSSAGGITGSSSVPGTTSFNVKVCDSANALNCTTGTFAVTSSNSLPAGGAESVLNGRYIMQMGGFNNSIFMNNGQPGGYAVVQAVTFDGGVTDTVNHTGKITAVSEDFNNPSSHSTIAAPSTATGFYTLSGTPSTGYRGMMVINYGSITLQYALAVGNLNPSSIAQDMRVIEFDNSRPGGSHPYGTSAGVGKLQTTTSLTTNQNYVFGMQGETPCTFFNNNGCSNGVFTPFGSISAVGRFFVNSSNGITGGQEDAGANNNSYNGITLTGTYTSPDAGGRGSMTITSVGSIYPKAPSNFVYYVVSPTELYIMSIDSHTNFTLLSGDVVAQTATFTNSSTLTNGNYLAYEQAPVNGNGTNYFPDNAGSSLVLLSITGNQANIIQDSNNANAGQTQLGQTQGPIAVTITSAGRMTFTGGGGGSPVFYLANNSLGFGSEQSTATNQGDTGLLMLEQQTGGPFSCATDTGAYFLGIVQPPVRMNVVSGTFIQNGLAASTATVDNSDPSGVLSQGQTLSLTCADANIAGSTGRFIYTSGDGTSVGYNISPNKMVLMNTNLGEDHPNLIVLQK